MISGELLARAAIVFAALVVGCTAVYLGAGVARRWRARRDAPRLAIARAELASVLLEPHARRASTVGGGAAKGARSPGVDALARSQERLLDRVLGEVAPSLVGTERERLAALAEELGLLARARRRCGSRRWWVRLRAARRLQRYGTDDEAAVRALTGDRNEIVRAQAAEWLGDHPHGADAVERLVALTADPALRVRVTAADSLLRAGPLVVPALAAALDVRPRADLLALALFRPDPAYAAPARRVLDDQEAGVEARAAAAGLLGALGGDVAVATLVDALADGDAPVRAAAASSLGRLAHWPAANDVAPLLRDPSWDVRLAAGEALAAMGAPGRLLLRRWRGDDDPFARDMAMRVLQVDALRSGTR